MLAPEGLGMLRLQGGLGDASLAPHCALSPRPAPGGRKQPGGLWRPPQERRQAGLAGEALAQEDCMGSLLLGGCGQGAPLGDDHELAVDPLISRGCWLLTAQLWDSGGPRAA